MRLTDEEKDIIRYWRRERPGGLSARQMRILTTPHPELRVKERGRHLVQLHCRYRRLNPIDYPSNAFLSASAT